MRIEPDWKREKPKKFWDPGPKLIRSIRDYQKNVKIKNPIGYFLKKLSVIRYKFWSVVSGADIPIQCKLGGGLMLPHPNGIVIHSRAEIGVNCIIFQQVTIGGLVKVGSNVDIGAGAKIIGKRSKGIKVNSNDDNLYLKIGNHVKIGANSVVLTDLPPFSTAVGVPARIIKPYE